MPNLLDKGLPFSPDAERSILGVILLNNEALAQVTLDTQDFFLHSHQALLALMRELHDAGNPVDLVTVGQALLDRGALEAVGGASYIASLTDGMPRYDNISHYVEIVREKARQRRAIIAGRDIAFAAADGNMGAVEALTQQIAPSPNGKGERETLLIPDGAWCDVGKVYLEAVRDTTSASINYHFAVFLCIAGATLGRSVHFNDGEIYPNFFMGLVGESSYAKKGTAMRYGKRLLQAVGAPVHWLMSVDSAAGFTKELATRQTEEKSKNICCLLHFPELRSLIDKANREGSRDIIPKISEAYDCEDLQRVVVGGSGIATNTFTAMLGGAAPEWLTNLKESDLKGGIGNRICWIPGEEKEPLHKRPPVKQRLWNSVVTSLHDCRQFWAGTFAEKPSTEMTLSPEADELMEAFGKSLYRDTKGEPLIRELCGRMENHCIKTAMVYAAIERVPVIEAFHLQKAILFCEFLLKALYAIFSTYGLSEIVRQERRIIELIEQAGGVINQRTLQRKLPRLDAEAFHRRLRWMIGQDSYIRSQREGRSTMLYLNR